MAEVPNIPVVEVLGHCTDCGQDALTMRVRVICDEAGGQRSSYIGDLCGQCRADAAADGCQIEAANG